MDERDVERVWTPTFFLPAGVCSPAFPSAPPPLPSRFCASYSHPLCPPPPAVLFVWLPGSSSPPSPPVLSEPLSSLPPPLRSMFLAYQPFLFLVLHLPFQSLP
mmetsp:Transcript_53998/g.117760  ORF Transcript_53998/g.117760 Transcript_53998/m.117760 type:complete len:103 (-) Transcript_53998:141-449(-)|eukprot:1514724-Pleurochrysis_carterae.AAC.8